MSFRRHSRASFSAISRTSINGNNKKTSTVNTLTPTVKTQILSESTSHVPGVNVEALKQVWKKVISKLNTEEQFPELHCQNLFFDALFELNPEIKMLFPSLKEKATMFSALIRQLLHLEEYFDSESIFEVKTVKKTMAFEEDRNNNNENDKQDFESDSEANVSADVQKKRRKSKDAGSLMSASIDAINFLNIYDSIKAGKNNDRNNNSAIELSSDNITSDSNSNNNNQKLTFGPDPAKRERTRSEIIRPERKIDVDCCPWDATTENDDKQQQQQSENATLASLMGDRNNNVNNTKSTVSLNESCLYSSRNRSTSFNISNSSSSDEENDNMTEVMTYLTGYFDGEKKDLTGLNTAHLFMTSEAASKIKNLGKVHMKLGVTQEMYGQLIKSLLVVIRKRLELVEGENFDADFFEHVIAKNWQTAYELYSHTMLSVVKRRSFAVQSFRKASIRNSSRKPSMQTLTPIRMES